MRRALIVSAGLACMAPVAFADPVPSQMQGRWSDAQCSPNLPVLQLTAKRFDIVLHDKTIGSLEVDAQGQPTADVDLRISRIVEQVAGGGVDVGDVITIRLDADRLLLVAREIQGKRSAIRDKPLIRCGS